MSDNNASQNITEPLSMLGRLKNLPKHYDNSSNDNYILSKLNGLNITLANGNIDININDIITKNCDETQKDFEIRIRLTNKLLNIELPKQLDKPTDNPTDKPTDKPKVPGFNLPNKINTITAINIGNMIMKKCKLGLKYDVDTESVITYFIKKL